MEERDELSPSEVRGGLAAAARALAATAATMDRIADLLTRWDGRAVQDPPTHDDIYPNAWGRAAAELRTAIAPMGEPISKASREVNGRG